MNLKNSIIMTISGFFIVSCTLLLMLISNIEEIQLKKDIFVYEFQKTEISTNISDYIIASDQVKKDAQLNLSAVHNEIGTYECSVTYLGKVYPFKIQLVDTTSPVASLVQVQWNISLGATLVANDLVEVTDSSAKYTAYFLDDNGLEESKTYVEEGIYIESVFVRDSSNNSSSTLRVKVNVTSNNNVPTFNGVDSITLEVGSYFHPLAGVSASDGLGNDISDEIIIVKDNVDTSVEGIYEVIYAVTNVQGNNIQRSRKVVVE